MRNGRVITPARTIEADILIEEGKITAVGRDIPTSNADRLIDARGKFILPGGIDAHAHLYDPKFTNREDFRSGTAAAAAGGVTTVIEMVLQSPADTPERVVEKIQHGSEESIVDFSLHAGMMNAQNMRNIGELAKLGVRSFKAFMCQPYYVDHEVLYAIMRETKRHRAITNVHAEDERSVARRKRSLIGKGRKDPIAHNESKPNSVEAKAIADATQLARNAKAWLHVSHVSTRQGVQLVRAAKGRGTNVTAETCPHYLTFTRRDVLKHGPYLKVNPPLKTAADLKGLWDGLRNGTVDMVTSEHAPGERSEKEVGWENIWEAWGGVPSIETMLPILLSEGVNKGRISLQDLCRIMCENPAATFGLYPRKGRITKGADADLVILDLALERKVAAESLHYKVGWTPYEGWTLKGWPVMTILRGEVVAEEGQVLGRPGLGKFVPMKL